MSDPVVGDESYRACPQCRRDCEPVPFQIDEGLWISFICPLHGVHTVVDPFSDSRGEDTP
jgi:hypothetical protein